MVISKDFFKKKFIKNLETSQINYVENGKLANVWKICEN